MLVSKRGPEEQCMCLWIEAFRLLQKKRGIRHVQFTAMHVEKILIHHWIWQWLKTHMAPCKTNQTVFIALTIWLPKINSQSKQKPFSFQITELIRNVLCRAQPYWVRFHGVPAHVCICCWSGLGASREWLITYLSAYIIWPGIAYLAGPWTTWKGFCRPFLNEFSW